MPTDCIINWIYFPDKFNLSALHFLIFFWVDAKNIKPKHDKKKSKENAIIGLIITNRKKIVKTINASTNNVKKAIKPFIKTEISDVKFLISIDEFVSIKNL